MLRACVRTGVLVAIAIIGMVAPSPRGARASVAQEGEASDSAAVRLQWTRLDAMWNARDAQRFSDLFAADGSFEFVDRGESLEGRATILQHFAERFPTLAPDLRHRTSVRDIRVIAPRVRTVDGKVEILRNAPAGGAEPMVLRTFAIFAVMLHTEQGWSIRELRVYQLPAATGADPLSLEGSHNRLPSSAFSTARLRSRTSIWAGMPET